jgi:hypothetical protein
MAGDKRLFTSLRPLDTSRHVKCGGGYLNVTGIGTAIIECGWNRLVLENAQYVPGLSANLIFGGALDNQGLKGDDLAPKNHLL